MIQSFALCQFVGSTCFSTNYYKKTKLMKPMSPAIYSWHIERNKMDNETTSHSNHVKDKGENTICLKQRASELYILGVNWISSTWSSGLYCCWKLRLSWDRKYWSKTVWSLTAEIWEKLTMHVTFENFITFYRSSLL